MNEVFDDDDMAAAEMAGTDRSTKLRLITYRLTAGSYRDPKRNSSEGTSTGGGALSSYQQESCGHNDIIMRATAQLDESACHDIT